MLIAIICVVSAAWYTPRVIRSDRRLFTGTVTSSGVITLDFAGSGQIKKINVRLGQTVRKGQVLATEYAPTIDSVVAADKAAIAYDHARIRELRAAEAAKPAASAVDNAQISASQALLALDQARLAAERLKAVATEIVAPSFGTVVAANGQAGEAATPSGVADYPGGFRQPLPAQQPEFSLFPQGPQSTPRASARPYPSPVIALRTSTTWQVVALIPEDSVSGIESGKMVRISVPAANVSDVPGRIDSVLPAPVPISAGAAYQALVTITGHTRSLPLNGMAADIQVGS